MSPAENAFECFAGERLRGESAELARTWVQRLDPGGTAATVAGSAAPAVELDAALTAAISSIADFVVGGEETGLREDGAVIAGLMALGRGWRRAGRGIEELIEAFDVLARMLDSACLEWISDCPGDPAAPAVVRVAGRLNRAPLLLGRISAAAFAEVRSTDGGELADRMGRFADLVVHELRTPLAAAEMAAAVLESDAITATAQERVRFAALIQRNLRHASTLLRDVQSLALAADVRRRGRCLPLGQVVGAVLAEVREVVRAEDVRLEVDEPLAGGEVDAFRIALILRNLISNAARYSDRSRAVRWIRLGVTRTVSGDFSFVVCDNGLGIAPEERSRIFERGFRAHAWRAEGTGFGLAVVQEAVRQLGGEITVESEVGVGTTFRVVVPGD